MVLAHHPSGKFTGLPRRHRHGPIEARSRRASITSLLTIFRADTSVAPLRPGRPCRVGVDQVVVRDVIVAAQLRRDRGQNVGGAWVRETTERYLQSDSPPLATAASRPEGMKRPARAG
jgi:hypothetical protein